MCYTITSCSHGGIGRRDRLKIYFSQESIGSSPIASTMLKFPHIYGVFILLVLFKKVAKNNRNFTVKM